MIRNKRKRNVDKLKIENVKLNFQEKLNEKQRGLMKQYRCFGDKQRVHY